MTCILQSVRPSRQEFHGLAVQIPKGRFFWTVQKTRPYAECTTHTLPQNVACEIFAKMQEWESIVAKISSDEFFGYFFAEKK